MATDSTPPRRSGRSTVARPENKNKSDSAPPSVVDNSTQHPSERRHKKKIPDVASGAVDAAPTAAARRTKKNKSGAVDVLPAVNAPTTGARTNEKNSG